MSLCRYGEGVIACDESLSWKAH